MDEIYQLSAKCMFMDFLRKDILYIESDALLLKAFSALFE